jgi:competence protein ComEC
MRTLLCLACAMFVLAWNAALFGQEMKIYFLDVDGGQATLIVADDQTSMLVDAGWPGFEGRDTEKILKAARDAGIQQLDVMLTTHYHTDHVGGVPQLAARIPIKRYVDHGPIVEDSLNASRLYQRYLAVREKGEHQKVVPGDQFPLGSATVHVVSARKQLIENPLAAPGAGIRPSACADGTSMPGDDGENAMSIGTVIEFGKFRLLNLADLLWNEEQALVCPVNKIGDIDVFLTSHHGLRTSNNPVLVRAIRPLVAVMNNGEKKGGDPDRWNAIRQMPGIEGFWQTQKSVLQEGRHNVPDDYIASLSPQQEGAWIQVVARRDGSFTVTNSRNGLSKSYGPRH